MEIRKKLSFQFLTIVALILLFSSSAIYLSFSQTRREDFYDRLGSKAKMVAQMLIEIDEINAELLKRIELNNPLSLPNEKIVIYDYLNRIIYSSDESHELQISQEMIDEVRLNDDIRLKQGKYEILGQFYTSQYDRFVVFAAAMDIFGIKKLRLLRIILLPVFFISLVIAFFSGNLFAKRALKPISDIMAQVDDIDEATLDSRINEGNSKDELSRLAQTFNKMLDRLEITFQTQKSFIANASHELRTPLTAITLQLEVILIKARSNEEYRKTILSVLDDIRNLNQISNRLLLLAQASSDYHESEFLPLRIDDIIWQARKEILKRDPLSQVSVNFSDEIDSEAKLTIRGNELLVKTAVLNLMDNGCKYSPDHTSEVMLDYQNDRIMLTFKDRGIGIPEDEIDLIFQPFYRAGNAMSIKGHGIGLSLVQRIVVMHKGEIAVSSAVNVGSVFTVSFRTL